MSELATCRDGLLSKPPTLPGLGPGSVVLVAGGSGAIGQRCAAVLAAMGVSVGIMARSSGVVERAADEVSACGTEALGCVGDITRPSDARRFIDLGIERWGYIDGLVNAAAVSDSGNALADIDVGEIETVMRTNFQGALLLAQAVSRPMIARGRGSIVNISSIGGHRATPRRTVYGPSKAALEHLGRQLAVELGPSGVRVNTVSPGQTPTKMRGFRDIPGGAPTPTPSEDEGRKTVTVGIPLQRRGSLDDYAGPVLFLLSNLSAYVTGVSLWVDGGVAVMR